MLSPTNTAARASPLALELRAEQDGSISHMGAPMILPPKETGVLHALISGWPDVVPKQHFSQQVWRGDMSDESLARSITQLRHALSAIKGISIRSVYGRGYQLLIAAGTATAPSASTDRSHSRLIGTALAPTQLAESLLHARYLLQQRSRSATERAESILLELLESSTGYMPAKVVYGEYVSCMLCNGWKIAPEKISQTLAMLAEVERQAPETGGLSSQRAHLLDCLWRYDEAAALHQQALQKEADDPTSHYHHAWHLIACGHMAEARDALLKAHDLSPYTPSIMIMLARVHVLLNDPVQARQWSMRAHSEHPESSQAYVFWLSLEALLEPRQELAQRAESIALDTLSWSFAPASLAFILSRCGHPQKARALIAQWNDDNHQIHALYAFAMLQMDDSQQAFDMLTRAAAVGSGFLPLALRLLDREGLRGNPTYDRVCQHVFARLPDGARGA